MDKKRLPRDSAGYCDLVGGTGPILGMCPAGDCLEVYKIDKTFRIHTPDDLDPERKDPNMSFVVTSTDDVGSGNLIVARVFIQFSESIERAPIRPGLRKESIIKLVHNSKEVLLSCERARLEFFQKYEACRKEFEAGKIQRKGNVIPLFPTVDNLDAICTSFLINAKRFIEVEVKIFNEFFQTTFDGPYIHYVTGWVEKHYSHEKDFIALLTDANKALKRIIDLRNFQEHPKKEKSTHINNFRLLPHNQVGLPTWHLTGEKPVDMASDMFHMVRLLMEFSELFTFKCLLMNLATPIPYTVVEVPDTERKKEWPIRYRLEIDQAAFYNRK